MVAGRSLELDDALAHRLQAIRRRLTLFAAVDGATLGTALGAAVAAALVALVRWQGAALGAPRIVATVAAAAVAGGIVRAARPISLAACARRVDLMLDRQDRVLSAVWLAGSATPLARAAVRDALARTEHLAPSAAAPARRPVGLGALAASAVALAVAWLVPGGTHAARLPAPRPAATASAPLPAAALEAERAVIAAALARAQASGDRGLRELAASLDQIVRGLKEGTVDEAGALEALRAVEQRASEAAAQAARDAQAASAVEKALAASAATRDAAEALRVGATGDQTAAALGDSAARQPAATGAALRAAATAMSAAASASESNQGDQPGRRRLRQDEASGAEGAGAGNARPDEESRKLERLSRDLDDAGARCAQGDPSCSARAQSGGRELSQVQRRGESGPSMRELQRATRQLHDRIARGDLRGDSGAARAFARAAAGGSEPGQRNDGSGSSSSSEQSGSQAGSAGADSAAAAAAAGAAAGDGNGDSNGFASPMAAGAGQSESAAAGGGIGHESGGRPLGGRDSPAAPAGRDARVPTADSAGPNRAQVIDGAAGRGFASRPYARVYTEYRAAVEDALGTASVPPGQQYLVRRYFDLIRPRTPAAHGGAP